jgi:hypothetical protein
MMHANKYTLTPLRPAFSCLPKPASFLNASPKFPNKFRDEMGLATLRGSAVKAAKGVARQANTTAMAILRRGITVMEKSNEVVAVSYIYIFQKRLVFMQVDD